VPALALVVKEIEELSDDSQWDEKQLKRWEKLLAHTDTGEGILRRITELSYYGYIWHHVFIFYVQILM
jgi:hypothetical protein